MIKFRHIIGRLLATILNGDNIMYMLRRSLCWFERQIKGHFMASKKQIGCLHIYIFMYSYPVKLG